jgi:hypothetical protein
MKTTRNKKPAENGITLDELSASLGISILACKLMGALGMPGFEYLRPMGKTADDVASFCGVSRRTVQQWFATGCPGKGPDGYDVVGVLRWRLSQGDVPESVFQKAKHEPIRALFRVLTAEIIDAADGLINRDLADFIQGLDKADQKRLVDLLTDSFKKRLLPLCLQEAAVEQLIRDCKGLL